MVQVTALEGDEPVDSNTFSKDAREDLREFRLRVVMESPQAPPSPVPEEAHHDPSSSSAAAAGGAARAAHQLSPAATENTALKARLDAVTKDRDELRRRLDKLQGGGAASGGARGAGGQQRQAGLRLGLVHLALAAVLAFVVGLYINSGRGAR